MLSDHFCNIMPSFIHRVDIAFFSYVLSVKQDHFFAYPKRDYVLECSWEGHSTHCSCIIYEADEIYFKSTWLWMKTYTTASCFDEKIRRKPVSQGIPLPMTP